MVTVSFNHRFYRSFLFSGTTEKITLPPLKFISGIFIAKLFRQRQPDQVLLGQGTTYGKIRGAWTFSIRRYEKYRGVSPPPGIRMLHAFLMTHFMPGTPP
jgi:hypothetical protein